MTKNALRQLLSEATKLSEEFDTEIRPAYAIDITDAGGVQWMIPEQQFFRYLVAFEEYLNDATEHGVDNETAIAGLDADIEGRLLRNCSERYQ